MDRQTDRAAPLLVLAGSVALAASLFLRWYEVRRGGPTYTAWETFSKADIALAVAAAGGAVAAVLAFITRQRWPYLGGAIAGSLAAALIVYLVSRPPGTSVAVGAVTDYGAFVGIAGALILVVGAVWSGLAPVTVAPTATSPATPPPRAA
jgi:peptidoglycan biosynthesis protein MviN/MurJ (putative lipid II flippase)